MNEETPHPLGSVSNTIFVVKNTARLFSFIFTSVRLEQSSSLLGCSAYHSKTLSKAALFSFRGCVEMNHHGKAESHPGNFVL